MSAVNLSRADPREAASPPSIHQYGNCVRVGSYERKQRSPTEHHGMERHDEQENSADRTIQRIVHQTRHFAKLSGTALVAVLKNMHSGMPSLWSLELSFEGLWPVGKQPVANTRRRNTPQNRSSPARPSQRRKTQATLSPENSGCPRCRAEAALSDNRRHTR